MSLRPGKGRLSRDAPHRGGWERRGEEEETGEIPEEGEPGAPGRAARPSPRGERRSGSNYSNPGCAGREKRDPHVSVATRCSQVFLGGICYE